MKFTNWKQASAVCIWLGVSVCATLAAIAGPGRLFVPVEQAHQHFVELSCRVRDGQVNCIMEERPYASHAVDTSSSDDDAVLRITCAPGSSDLCRVETAIPTPRAIPSKGLI